MSSSKQSQCPLSRPAVDPVYEATKAQILFSGQIHAIDDAIHVFTSQLLAQTDWQDFAAADAGLKMRECKYILQWAKLEEVAEGRKLKNWMARKETYLCDDDACSGEMDMSAADTVMGGHDGVDSWQVDNVGNDREANGREKLHQATLRGAMKHRRWEREAGRLMRDALAYGVPLDLPRLRH